jgi:hypothetical protein
MKTSDWTKRIQERVKWKQLRSPRLSDSEVVAPEEVFLPPENLVKPLRSYC